MRAWVVPLVVSSLAAAEELPVTSPSETVDIQRAAESAQPAPDQLEEPLAFEPRLRFGVGSWAGGGSLRLFSGGYIGGSAHVGIQFDDHLAVFVSAQVMALSLLFLNSILGTGSVMIERTFFDHLSLGIGGGVMGGAIAAWECRTCGASPTLAVNVPVRIAYNFIKDIHLRHRFYVAADGGLGFPLLGNLLPRPAMLPCFYVGFGLGYAMM
jgi:hypothetical protein